MIVALALPDCAALDYTSPAGIVGPDSTEREKLDHRLISLRIVLSNSRRFGSMRIAAGVRGSQVTVAFDHAAECRSPDPARWLVLLVLVLVPGCTSVKMTGTRAHGDGAALADRNLGQCPLTGRFQLAGRARKSSSTASISLSSDKEWIISTIRRTMAEQGLLLENNKDKAQVIVEVAFGAYGTDKRDRKFGLAGFQYCLPP